MYLNLLRRLPKKQSCQFCFEQRRFKSKKRKHSSNVQKNPTEVALEHFDKYHRPVYGDQWPSIRLALLSPQKYSALVNNYADVQETVINLASEGAQDILKIARDCETSDIHATQETDTPKESVQHKDLNLIENEEGQIVSIHAANDLTSDLYTFMPTKKVGSAMEQLKQEEADQNLTYNTVGSEQDTEIIADTDLLFPPHLKAFAFERGDTTRFPRPRIDSSGKTDCYMYDAASLLPAIALDLKPGCDVLDLCAAPGGKSLTILQTMYPSSLTCVEPSFSRMKRLKEVLKQYIPGGHGTGQLISTVCKDGNVYCQGISGESPHDRVLVDVPCLTDRHVLHESDNNIFKGGRVEERVRLPKLQAQLLFRGIQACQPGGIIVYSTCTLSPVQNDGVVRLVLEKLWQETNIGVAVVDTSHLANRFGQTFSFHRNCKFGQLVVPHLTANFGPMYFCKLKRLN